MTTVRLGEVGPWRPAQLTAEQARRLHASGVVEVRPGSGAGEWLLRAANHVGVAKVGDVELRIEPKVPVARLLFLVGYARNPAGWRNETVELAEHADLVPAVAAALARQTERALRPGLLQGYQTVDDTGLTLRGRLRERDQMSRRHGLALPLEIRHDEYTVDIAENRILATAVDRMLRVPGVDAEARRILRHLSGRFVGVGRLSPGEPVPAWQPTRLNARLLIALRLAELVLASASIEAGRAGVISNGFLVNMPSVYEDFLSAALRQAIEPRYGGAVVLQHAGHLDEARRINLRPDIVWRVRGNVAAVVDAKYKAHTPAADAYQMLAYCTVYGLRRGHLIYVSADHASTTHVVRNVGIEIVCHSLELSLPPQQLLEQVTGAAAQIISGARRFDATLLETKIRRIAL